MLASLPRAVSELLPWVHAGQKPQLAADAARFVQLSVPAVFFTGVAECLKRYLMAQGVVFPAAGEEKLCWGPRPLLLQQSVQHDDQQCIVFCTMSCVADT